MANEPITREEMLLNAVATGEAANLEPITREEMFLAKLGGADVTTPMPITRKEQFLMKAVEAMSGGNTGGDGNDSLVLFLQNELTEYSNDKLTSIATNAFQNKSALQKVSIPNLTSVPPSAFNGCSGLLEYTGSNVTEVGNYAFSGCKVMAKADFSNLTTINQFAFNGCSALKALIIRNTRSMCGITNRNALNGTPIYSDDGYIYVPSARIVSYQAATNWSEFVDHFRSLEDYTVDGTVTGELDPNKI